MVDTLKEKPDRITYRDMLVEYLKLRPWYRFAIHLIVGQFVDKKIDGLQAMALPKYFMQGLDDMRVSGRSIVTKEDRIIIGITGIQYIPLSYYPLLAALIVILWRYQREARNTSSLKS